MDWILTAFKVQNFGLYLWRDSLLIQTTKQADLNFLASLHPGMLSHVVDLRNFKLVTVCHMLCMSSQKSWAELCVLVDACSHDGKKNGEQSSRGCVRETFWWPTRVALTSQVSVSQTLAVLSTEALARYFPSSENLSERVPFEDTAQNC